MRWIVLLCGLGLSVSVQAELSLSQEFHSQALDGPMSYSIYLPPGHDSGAVYPVIYLLHGVGDNERAWPNLGQVEDTMEQLIREGLPPMIVVMPAAKRSWYVDSADIDGPGDYATAVRDDLRAHLAANYPVLDARQGRFIAGHSMGGFGALRLALAHPELYDAAASLSAALWSRVTPDTQLNERQEGIFNGSFGAPWQATRFLQLHPKTYLETLTPEQVPGLLITAGDDDYFGAYRSSFELFLYIRERQIPVELRIDDGGHRWGYWRRTFPSVVRFFARRFMATPAQ